MRPVLRRWLADVLRALVLLLASALVAGELGRLAWWLDLLAHFRLQYAVMAALTAGGLFVLGSRWFAAGALVVAAVAVAPVLALYRTPTRAADGGPPLRILHYNVDAKVETPPYDEVVRYVRQLDPEIVFIQEATPAWAEAFEALAPRYRRHAPFLVASATAGMMTLARVPLVFAKVRADLGAPAPAVEVELDWAGARWRILSTHALPPLRSVYAKGRDVQIAHAARWAAERPVRTVVIGDFNATPWSAALDPVEDAGLISTQRGFGYAPTWPARPAWLRPFAVPIDHAFVTPDLAAVARDRGPAFASDHRALWVSLVHTGTSSPSSTSR